MNMNIISILVILTIINHSKQISLIKKPSTGDILNDLLVDFYDFKSPNGDVKTKQKTGLNFNVKIEFENDPNLNLTPPNKQLKSTTNQNLALTLLGSTTNNASKNRALQNRDIKIVYKVSNNSKTEGMSKSGLNSLVSFEYVVVPPDKGSVSSGGGGKSPTTESTSLWTDDFIATSGYYLIKINKEFLIFVSAIVLVVLLTVLLLVCLFKCMKPKNDSYYFCRYNH